MHNPYWSLRAAPPLPPLILGPSHLIILFFIICMYSAFTHLFPGGIFVTDVDHRELYMVMVVL